MRTRLLKKTARIIASRFKIAAVPFTFQGRSFRILVTIN